MTSRIEKLIQSKKLTASAFADKIRVPRSTISHILSGRNNASLDVVQKILDAFPDVRTEWLVRGDGYMIHHSNSLFPEEEFAIQPSKPVTRASVIPEEKEISPVIPPDEDDISKPAESDSAESQREEIVEQREHWEQREQTEQAERKEQTKVPGKSLSAGDISRVLIFYADGTFSEHLPQQSDKK